MIARPEIKRHNGKKFILFFGAGNTNGVCSNFYKSNFTIDGVTFSCVEQYMMYMKAMTFNDTEIAKKILAETEPKEMKKYGRKVRGYVNEVWDSVRYEVVARGVYEKFNQNFGLKSWIEAADVDYFVECSPYDDIWGIKLPVTDIKAMEPTKWCGTNLLGQCLKDARDKLFGTEEKC